MYYQYDELSRLTAESNSPVLTNSSNTGIVNGNFTTTLTSYTYDDAGNRTNMTTLSPPNKKGGTNVTLYTNYTYDAAERLTERTVKPYKGEVINDTSGLNTNVDVKYFYDGNGSLVAEQNQTDNEATLYGYDTRNRLTSWQKTKGSDTAGQIVAGPLRDAGLVLARALFSYDGADSRIGMVYSEGAITSTGGIATSTSYLQDATSPLAVVLQESSSSGGVSNTNSYLYQLGSSSPLFQSYGASNTNRVWYHSDGLGSVRALTNGSGQVQDTTSYSAFGGRVGESGKSSSSYGFAGEQLDPTGLYFNRARYYNPNLGRFISRDSMMGSLQDPTSLNRFIYTGNNPTLYTDPLGHDPWYNDPQDSHYVDNSNPFSDFKLNSSGTGKRQDPFVNDQPIINIKTTFKNSDPIQKGLNDGMNNSQGCNPFLTLGTDCAIAPMLMVNGLEVTQSKPKDGVLVGKVRTEEGDKGGSTSKPNESSSSESEADNGEDDLLRRIAKKAEEFFERTSKKVFIKGKPSSLTEPNAPDGVVVEEKGVTIRSYLKSGDHGPAHLHVDSEEGRTKIGQNGNPISKSPELTRKQKQVVDNNIKTIRKTIRQMQQYNRYNNPEKYYDTQEP